MIHLRLMDWAGVVLVLLIGYSLYRANKSDKFKDFNLIDLLMVNGRISPLACILMAAFIMLTWIMARLTLDNKMTEGYFTSYGTMCFVGSVVRLFVSAKEPSPTLGDSK